MKNSSQESDLRQIDTSLKKTERLTLWLIFAAMLVILGIIGVLAQANAKKESPKVQLRAGLHNTNAKLMIMQNKCTTSLKHSQHLIAGLLPTDNSIEFYGLPETLEVQWMQKGRTHSFKELPNEYFMVLMNAFNTHPEAKDALKNFKENRKPVSRARKVELYTYFMFGGLDSTPDMIDGILQDPENYRHEKKCISLKFKTLKLDGNPLKPREVQMIDLMLEDHKNTVIAMKMGIANPTFNQHDAELKKKAGVHSKPALLLKAWKEGVAQYFNKTA